MKLLDFLGMDEEDQWNEFFAHGDFVAKYESIDLQYNLYLVHDFFVELTSDSAMGLYQSMNAFLYGPRLDKYSEDDFTYITDTLNIRLP